MSNDNDNNDQKGELNMFKDIVGIRLNGTKCILISKHIKALNDSYFGVSEKSRVEVEDEASTPTKAV